MISRWKHPTIEAHLLGIVQGFGEIADGVVTICSLGFLMSGFEMAVARFRSKRYFEAQARKESEREQAPTT